MIPELKEVQKVALRQSWYVRGSDFDAFIKIEGTRHETAPTPRASTTAPQIKHHRRKQQGER